MKMQKVDKISDLTGSGVRHGDSGAEWRGINPTAKGRHWAVSRDRKSVV